MTNTKTIRRIAAAIPEDLYARLDRVRSHFALSPNDPDTGPSISVCVRRALEDWCDEKEKELGLLPEESRCRL